MDEMTKGRVDNSIYEKYGDRWYTAFDDPVAILRAASRFKTPWVVEKIRSIQGQKVLDVGCGGGFLSNALALENFKVTGIDLALDSLEVAHRHDTTKSVNYLQADASSLPFEDGAFDAVTAMDFLEHVENPAMIIQEISRVLRPGGVFIFHTFNRNFLSWLVVIKFIEIVVKNTPKNMHVLRLFIKPEELDLYCQQAQMKVQEMSGIKPVISSITLKSIISGVVPESLQFEHVRSLMMAYKGMAIKN